MNKLLDPYSGYERLYSYNEFEEIAKSKNWILLTIHDARTTNLVERFEIWTDEDNDNMYAVEVWNGRQQVFIYKLIDFNSIK